MSYTERLSKLYGGILHDVMRAAGLQNFTLPNTLKPLDPELKLAGPAFTVRGKRVQDASEHDTLFAWTGLLSKARPAHVLVIQAQDSELAHMGELSGETLKRKGVLGALVDGGCRDCAFLLRLQFPVWSRYQTPRDVVGCWLPEAFDEAIRIGEVLIHPGDYVFADRDGVLCIPAAHISTTLDQAEAMTQKENQVRTAILQGMDPQEAYLMYRKF